MEKKPEFNNGQCKKDCNCIDIAEWENGNNPVKQYECLKAADIFAPFLELNEAVLCVECKQPHGLTFYDAGSDREVARLCCKCFNENIEREGE